MLMFVLILISFILDFQLITRSDVLTRAHIRRFDLEIITDANFPHDIFLMIS